MSDAYDACTSVSDACLVEATVYGYTPSLPANALFLALSALCALVQLFLGIRHRTWSYMTGLLLGCITQSIGYVGRVMMHSNPWDENAFTIQITCLILGPAFISASVYLTLKHFALALGREKSLLRPEWYTWVFITADIVSIVLQAVGGALASSAETEVESDRGGNIMLAGIAWQVVSLAAFGVLGLLYAFRVWSRRAGMTAGQEGLVRSKRFRAFVGAVMLAYTTIMVRCIYRIPELAGGWSNELMRKELEFAVLDSAMVAIACLALTLAHPGLCFPVMGGRAKHHDEKDVELEDETGQVKASMV
ncbi:RTA1 like protein-domain-containing protein [Elsinoe ampelina]|uniref:RTA1 like protein-domain-containing protein n=1 Tax=Elsinoe ampelina TaxID=302913 RepID=A0A6A6GLJ6_9PEZI|nr:RTA1 like protein-domain-containing protein [Elsinoe ampelina]